MNRRTTAGAALSALLLLAFPTVAQWDEAQPYFSLQSSKTFAPGEKPVVGFWGHGIEKLQFRVYRVKDPVRFFEQLDDPHRFGGQARRVPGELTPIERFHRWKARSRAWLRDVLRHQYSAESRAGIRTSLVEREIGANRRKAPQLAEYAEVPLLNSQQVVSVWEQPIPKGNRWETQKVTIDVKDKGVYLVEATDGKLQAYTIVCVTDLAAVVKGAPGKLYARVLDRQTGSPVHGAEVIVWAARKEQLKTQSGADGLVESAVQIANDENALVLVRTRDDFTPSSLYGWSIGSAAEARITSYLYTDRPVYRPGHTVHFKTILRAMRESGYAIPAETQVEVQIEDPEGNSVFRKTMRPSAMGSLSGELTLGNAAALGYYGIQLKSGERYLGNGGFHVEEYKKPEYEVKVTPDQKRMIQGESVKVTIEGRYYFGEPVPGAKVTYAIYRSRYWLPYYDQEEMGEGGSEGDEDSYGNEQEGEQTGVLDSQGKLTVTVPTKEAKYDIRYRIEARVTDAANREISGTGYLLATRGSYFVHIEPDKYVYSPGDRARFRVEAKDYDGKPVAGAAFNVDLLEHRYGKKETDRVLQSVEGRTGADGVGAVELPVRAGSLVARVHSRTPEGREVEDSTWFWVSGGFDWGSERSQRVEIIPDKKSYKGGDTARLLIVTGVPDAWVWVTAEGRSVLESKLVKASGSSATVEIPIRSGYAPNFFVSAVFVHGGQLYQGAKSIKVPPVEQQLEVAVKASKAQYKPGEQGVFTIDAKDWQGRPVNAAEFSLGVVDESIYAIRRETAQDITKFFYGSSYNSVSTESSLNYGFSGEAGKRRMQLARLREWPASARGQLKGFVDPKVRKAFPDTIYWMADLRTDARGHAEARVEFPDSLTTWRATARGITADTRVGSAVEKTIVRKNLILRLAVPRFFREGDEVTISAIVQNYLDAEKTARVSLEAKGLELTEGATRDIAVSSKGTAQVDFRVRARTAGDAVLLGKALTNEESDALELTLPVLPYGVRANQSKAGAIRGDATTAETQLAIPQDANPSARTLEISLSPSVAGAVFGALEYLTTFPYGCTEQTMSSFLPNVIVGQAAKELRLSSTIDEAGLQKKIRAGLDRLYDYQHPDGGWGWWKTDDSQPFMTAYVVSGLARAKGAGYNIRPDAGERGAAWLKTQLPDLKKQSADLQAFVAYSLAEGGAADPAFAAAVWDQRSTLTPYGLSMIGLALRIAKDARSAEAAALLEGKAKVEGDEAWWPVERDYLLGIYMDATPEATAYAMKLLTAERPSSPLLAKAALYLVNHRSEGYYWSTTKQTAMVVYGLTDYLKQSGELKPDFSATVLVNGKQVASKRFTAAEALTGGGAPIRIAAGTANTVRVAKSGAGTLYWSARANWYSTATRQSKSGTGTLGINREYFRLVPEKSGDRIVHNLEPSNGNWQRGDVIAVRLSVTGSEWKYLLIEDPIPAGTELIEKDELYELKQKPEWWAQGWARRELHDDRVALFQTWFPSGGTVHTYLLKVVNPGRFRVSPAHVEPMYQPQYFATSDAAQVEVK